MEQSLVYVEYGKCAGLPALTGIGRITSVKERAGITYVHVEPVEGLPLPKWVTLTEVQYMWKVGV